MCGNARERVDSDVRYRRCAYTGGIPRDLPLTSPLTDLTLSFLPLSCSLICSHSHSALTHSVRCSLSVPCLFVYLSVWLYRDRDPQSDGPVSCVFSLVSISRVLLRCRLRCCFCSFFLLFFFFLYYRFLLLCVTHLTWEIVQSELRGPHGQQKCAIKKKKENKSAFIISETSGNEMSIASKRITTIASTVSFSTVESRVIFDQFITTEWSCSTLLFSYRADSRYPFI